MSNIKLSEIDIGVLVIYFMVIIAVGIWNRKRASKNIETYFLGGKALPWWALGMSSAAGSFDISGTMWVVSIMFLFGMKSWWIFAMFAFFIGAFLMSYMGRWLRRTNVMTAAEVLKARFGQNRGGVVSRTAYAIMAVIFMIFMIGMAFQGTGKFAATFLPFTPTQCAIGLFLITTIYVVLGGFISVIFTDVIQGVILSICSIIMAVIAFNNINPEILHANFSTSLLPRWRMPELAGTMHESYEMFGILCVVWFMTGFLMSLGAAGGGGFAEQRYLASPNTEHAAKTGAAHAFFYTFKYVMIAAITFLAISNLTNAEDPERILPTVLRDIVPKGIRGFMIAGFLAAFMSTFSTVVNVGASMVVRDLVQPFRSKSSQKTLILYSYFASIGIVTFGIVIGLQASSIDQIWSWIVIGLNASFIIPNLLRWYWWRLNGWGYAIGSLSGLILSLVVLFRPETPRYIYGPAINIISLIGCIAGSLLTKPIDKNVLLEFFRKVKPKGFWKPIRLASGLTNEALNENLDKSSIIVLNVVVGSIAILVYYLTFIYLIGHWYLYSLVSFGIAVITTLILYNTWYKKLKFDQQEENRERK